MYVFNIYIQTGVCVFRLNDYIYGSWP